jgi:hypothetical protein
MVVAAMKRTATLTERVPPSRSTVRSCSARVSFGWKSRRREGISSKNRVPPIASSNSPSFFA